MRVKRQGKGWQRCREELAGWRLGLSRDGFPAQRLTLGTIAGVGIVLLSAWGLGVRPAVAQGGLHPERGRSIPQSATPSLTIALPIAHSTIAQALAQGRVEQSVLGVIYENNSQWATAGQPPAEVQQTLRKHLEKAGIPFRLLPVNTLADSSILNRYTFLFLANVGELSPEQVSGLEAWLQRGGRLLLSGPIGSESSQGVREKLSRLLGVYWETYTDRPQGLQIRARESWIPQDNLGSPLAGGVLMPTRPESQVLATWSNPQDAAVIANDRLIFLGWLWGDRPDTQELDQAWLAASLDRFNRFGAVPLSPSPQADRPLSRPPNVQQPGSASSGSRWTAGRSPRSQSHSSGTIDRTPTPPIANSPNSPTPIAPSPTLAGRIQLPLPPQFDPSQEAAPPGLDVERGSEPIVFLEAVAMRKELGNLLGRFRSANLSMQMAASLSLKQVNKNTPPSNCSLSPLERCNPAGSVAVGYQPAFVTQIQNTLKRFPDLVADRHYGEARQEWLAARDSLLQNYPDSQPLQPEIRAVWLDRGTIVKAGSPQGLATLFDRLAASGINVVFFETLNASYPIYPSRVAPAQNPLTVGWDPLGTAVKLAHDRHMELHAWIWTFAAGNRAHNRILGLPADYLGPVLSRHPDWLNRNNRGGIWSANKPFFDPANPEVRRYIQAIIQEITDRYAVDGLQLDYIRYPFQDIAGGTTFGYGKAGRERFKQRTGVDPITLTPQHPLWEAWQNFRIEQIDSFVADVGADLRSHHPTMKLSVAVFAFPTHERLAKLQQNWEAWAKRGDVDMVCLMAYAMDTNRFEQITAPWLTQENLGGTLILGGVHLPSLPTPPLVLDQVQFLRDHATAGYILFATEQFQTPLQSRFHADPDTEMVLPHREPLKAALLRYSALEREWNWLTAQGQLSIAEDHRLAWEAGRQRLQQALTEAAHAPSPQTVQRATVELQTFEASFPVWFRWYAVDNRYQVRTWEYRLSVLTILLNYGERMLEQSRPIALEF